MSGYNINKLITAITVLQGIIDKATNNAETNKYLVALVMLADSHNMLVDIVKECKDANATEFVIIPMHEVKNEQ